MMDFWGLYGGKTPKQLNPHQLREGDLVVTPDGTQGRLGRPGFKWGYLEGRDWSFYPLTELRPIV